jgi:hypothetical protein
MHLLGKVRQTHITTAHDGFSLIPASFNSFFPIREEKYLGERRYRALLNSGFQK